MSDSTQKQCWNIIGYTGCSFFERCKSKIDILYEH